MAIQVALNHRTAYRYDRLVSLSPHVIRLRPAPHSRTAVLAYSLKVTPEKHFINWQQDPFGNYLARLVFLEPAQALTIEVDIVADMSVFNPFDFFLDEESEEYPVRYPAALIKELAPYLEITEHGPLLAEFLARVDRTQRRTVAFLVDLNLQVQQHVGYGVRLEPGVQTCEETLTKRLGSCRDTAWLLVQILRHLGLAARFVSGYLVQLVADQKPLEGPSGPTADFTDLHAWAEVYLPGAGWVGLDPTSGLFAGEGHIPLACAPDPQGAAPVTGATDVCEVTFEFQNSVQRVREDPRVTRPYSDRQWLAVEELGATVDRVLQESDVRLTLGGEPTFVSLDDVDQPEWNTTALSPKKRQLGDQLLKRLAKRFAPGALLHYGQGKWYPGEQLPRWAFSCYWRTDGVPVWRQPALIGDDRKNYGAGVAQAERFIRALAGRLGVDPALALPGYEDALYYLWKEGTLPANVDPLQVELKDPLERQRLARLLEHGLDKVTGFVLPLRWHDQPRSQTGGWQSGHWEFRRDRLFLLPGDSPMGYRLPLDSLKFVEPAKREPDPVRCTFEPRSGLPDYYGEVARRYSTFMPEQAHHSLHEQTLPHDVQSDLQSNLPSHSTLEDATLARRLSPNTPNEPEKTADDTTVRTALCVEPRDGKLYIFLPPLSHLEHFLDLISSIELTAAELDSPVFVEGYTPPSDPRLQKLAVTPDPGVIEVNMHPVRNWRELVDNTTALYEEARECRLGTEKFMLDGRHTGTGGGNHITLGGPTPADSPLLRRPDVLQSLITFWQHHPSLSYLFSGMFIGPTSQMPRIDEARNDSLYELEIAFQQMPRGEAPFPWLVDRLLRHLLIDLTGNTHRAEFCIDKLFSPDSISGRQGLLEMRAFEMPPHAQMSVVQQLLLRALIARFWNTPYHKPLVSWGTELHDRFMLPHAIAHDAQEVALDLGRHGYGFDPAWFDPFVEFRFPRYGTAVVEGMELELRMALEPWHVLGEEVSGSGTSRYVDSSVERLQVRISGMTNPRHIVICNGRRVPLRPTGRTGEFVAGVRYRAWNPPSALHPMIPVHAPLVFDVFDLWSDRSIGGCTYHVSHPGGLSYEIFPVNSYEAEARRRTRFWPYGHTPGPLFPPPEEPTSEFPCTLDLRRRAPRSDR